MTRGEHPDAIATASYLDGTIPRSERDDIEAHLADCDVCRSGVALLRLENAGAAGAVPPEALRRARALGTSPAAASSVARWRLALSAGLAAGLLAAAGVAIWMGGGIGSRATQSPLERDGAVPAIEALSPAHGEAVDADRLEFRWRIVDGADRYVVTVLDAGGSEIASLEARGAEGRIAWPADRPLPSAGTYLWSVRALALDRAIAETRPLPFEVR